MQNYNDVTLVHVVQRRDVVIDTERCDRCFFGWSRIIWTAMYSKLKESDFAGHDKKIDVDTENL